MKGAYSYAQQFITLLSEHFNLSPNTTHLGVITFSETAKLDIPFNKHEDHDAFQKDVSSLPFRGYITRIDLAFTLTNTHLFDQKYGARNDAEKLLILLTDGRQNSHDNSLAALRKAYDSSLPLLSKKVKIVAIGLMGTHSTDVAMLTYLTRNDKNVYMIDYLPNLSKPFMDGIANNYCPP